MPLGCCCGIMERAPEKIFLRSCGRQRTGRTSAAREPAYRPPPRPLSRSSSRSMTEPTLADRCPTAWRSTASRGYSTPPPSPDVTEGREANVTDRPRGGVPAPPGARGASPPASRRRPDAGTGRPPGHGFHGSARVREEPTGLQQVRQAGEPHDRTEDQQQDTAVLHGDEEQRVPVLVQHRLPGLGVVALDGGVEPLPDQERGDAAHDDPDSRTELRHVLTQQRLRREGAQPRREPCHEENEDSPAAPDDQLNSLLGGRGDTIARAS